MANKVKKKAKLSPKEMLKLILDEEALKNRKEVSNVAKEVIKDEVVIEEKKEEEFKWWNEPMKKEFFIKKKINNEHYGHYKYWKDNIWIGPYKTSKELDSVIKSYITETSKPLMERNIENVHSILLKD